MKKGDELESQAALTCWMKNTCWCLVGMDGNAGIGLLLIVIVDDSLIPY
jgi:hypothetical protein